MVGSLGTKMEELALDEALGEKKEMQQKLSDNNCVEAEQKAQAPIELRIRDDVVLKLEGNRSIQDQLQWKTEQFKHLEEAHTQLQEHCRLTEAAWERDKSAMRGEIFLLQTRLDSQTRVSNSLETCNQALTCQEHGRKLLEVQSREFKLRCRNEFREDKTKIESLTADRDEEIAGLRNSLGNMETLFKELKLRVAHLEQEDRELGISQRNARTASLVTKLHNKLKWRNLKARESEWRSQMEEMNSSISNNKSDRKSKEEEIQVRHMDLENFHSAVDVLNEEISILFMIFKFEFSEAYCTLLNEMRICSKEKDDKISSLTEQLEMKNGALNNAQHHLEQEHEKVATLLKRIESLDLMDRQQILLIEELEKHKRMLRESSECQLRLKQQVLQMENAVKYDRRELFETLEKVELELAEKIRDGNQLEVELRNINSAAKSLKNIPDESEYTCRQMEDNPDLSVVTQQTTTSEREALEALIEERDNLLRISEEKDCYVDTLHDDISWLMEDSIRRELEVEKAFKEEEKLLKVLNEKEQKFRDLQVLIMSIEEDLISTVISYFSEIAEIQLETSAISETLNKVEHQRTLEIEEKNNVIAELEEELKAHKAETQKLMNQLGNEKSSMMILIKELELENGVLLRDMKKLYAEKENVLVHIEEFCDQLSEVSCEDAKLMKTLQESQSWKELNK